MYGARHLGDARALFLFRSERELDYHHRDAPRQKELLRGAFDGLHADVDRWLDELDRTPAFYFDSIAQLRMDTWSRGRVTLVGDAGYCPGPAVGGGGGGTSLAVVGAYVLAGELARAGGDHERALLRLTTKSARLYNSMTVDDYPPSPTASGGRVGLAGDPGGGLGSGLGVG